VGTVLVPLLVVATSLPASPAAAAATRDKHHHRSVAYAQTPLKHAHRRPVNPLLPIVGAVVGKGSAALRFAVSQLGKPYRYGGAGPDSYDCSGLTQRAWRIAGVSIPRTTQEQAHIGSPVALSRIRPGDLVVFYADESHVGIYAGSGKVIVSPHSGSVISFASLRSMPISTVRRPG
jgi:cell wall-associated NlpC family hydrolase